MSNSRFRWLAAALGAVAFATIEVFARAGGGCLAEGTRVATPSGEVAIEMLRVGDAVWSFVDGERTVAQVAAVFAVESTEFVECTAQDGRVLLATPEHPLALSAGTFRRADAIDASTALSGQTLTTVRRIATGGRRAYNLLVTPGGVFFANGFLVHNKGCFLPDTPVLLPDGSRRAISHVRVGDTVLAFESDGHSVPARVVAIYTHDVASYLVVRTACVELRVTEEHPFYVGDGTFRTIGALQVGDTIWAHDGAGGLVPQQLVAVERVDAPAKVYNLQTEEPHTYFADGVAVHNKGGGGGSRSSGGSSRRSSSSSSRSYSGGGGRSGGGEMPGFVAAILLVVFGTVIVVVVIAAVRNKTVELDHNFSRDQIAAKSEKTWKLAEFVGRTDSTCEPSALVAHARETFLEVQRCWAARDYSPLKERLLPDLFAQHSAQLEGLRRTHEINKLDELQVEAVDLVHLRYTEKPAERAFTALLSAKARDIYLDDRTNALLRGDDEAASFQEFWTFRLVEKTWRLAEIEQTQESSALTEENFFEQFTDTARDQIYGESAGRTGPAGPTLPAAVQAKDDKIERLLNFLVQTDRIWNRETMLGNARRVYLNVLLAWQDGRPEALGGLDLSPDCAGHLRGVNEANQRNGWRVEYRNLCIRKVEIVHVDNRDERTLDNFTARISAHAQRQRYRGDTLVQSDPDVRAWVEFATFRRDGVRWVLHELLPDAAAEAALARENVDEGTGAQMLQWYYSKPRAT